MRRCLLALALVSAGGVQAGDDLTTCNNENAHQAENISACDRLISSGQFSGAALRDLHLNRGKHSFSVRDGDKAYADFSRALQIDPRNSSLLEWLFLSAVSSGRIDEGVGLARRILTIDKNHKMSRLVTGVAALKSKQYAAALPDIRQSARGSVTDVLAALLSGWASYGAGDVKAAIAAIDKTGSEPWSAVFRDFHAGLVFEQADRQPDAGVRFERAVKLDGSVLRPAQAYANWLSRNRDPAAARAAFEATESRIPNQPLLHDGRRLAVSGEKLPPLVDSPQTGAAEALTNIGAPLTRSDSAAFAQIYLQLALYLRPDHGLALISLGDLYDHAKQFGLAIETYRRISTGSPLWRIAQTLIAASLDKDGKTDEASRMLRSLIADDPRDPAAIVALGDIERNRKKFVECAQTYSSAIDTLARLEPPHWTLLYSRGICRERSKQWSLAEADLRKALELQPEQYAVLNYLGYSLVDQGRNIDEALSLIRRSLAQRPDDGYVVDSLGWAYFRTGNFQEAEKNLRRAVELVPKDPVVHMHLGDVFWRQGRKAQARAEWADARRLGPEQADLAEIEDRIRDGLPESGSVSAKQEAKTDSGRLTARAEPGPTSVPTNITIPAGRRVALVIGNSDYRSVPALANPSRDSRAVSDALRQVGFQSVTLVSDASRDKMVEALRAFATEADKADWALIYYAGHGIEVAGQNYLVPVDAKLASDRDVQYEAVSLEQVTSAAEGASKLRLVMLDACRDNPFANMMKRTTASRSVGRGLGQVEPDAGTLLVYAAKHGQIAFDGDGENSPFVSAFVKRIATPQIEIRKLFDLVRDDVMTATKRQQQPFTYGSVPGSEDFYFLISERARMP